MDEKTKIVSDIITSLHKNKINEAIDECTNKTLDFESAKLLKELIEVSMNQICEAFINQIKQIKATADN